MSNLIKACRDGDFEIVKKLVQEGSDVNESEEEWSGLAPLTEAARGGHNNIVEYLLKEGADVNKMEGKGNTALLWACKEGYLDVVSTLLTYGANIEATDHNRRTALAATVHGAATGCKLRPYKRSMVCKLLILAGASVDQKDKNGDTVLHVAARDNCINCGIVLAEAGADLKAKNRASERPLDLASEDFKAAVLRAASFRVKKTVCVVGNALSGKSTLIASLQSEASPFFAKVSSRVLGVKDIRQRTSGIDPVSLSSKKYGDVVFFDFAGQHEYHGPHEMFLRSILRNSGTTVAVIVVIKTTEGESTILQQLYHWLIPISALCTSANVVKVIAVGSFLDKVLHEEQAKSKVLRCFSAVDVELRNPNMEFEGVCFLDCRQTHSSGINRLCQFLKDVPLPHLTAWNSQYSLCWLATLIHKSFVDGHAIILSDLEKWLYHLKSWTSLRLVPQLSSAEAMCNLLSATGNFLYLPNQKDLSQSWLILDLPAILHEVYGTLFSPSSKVVDKFGLLTCRKLSELFPNEDKDMIQNVLVTLEFCVEVNPLFLKEEIVKLKGTAEEDFLFFPALVSAQPPVNLQTLFAHEGNSNPILLWELRTNEKHFISPWMLQTILLRLAANHVFQHQLGPETTEHCCSVWYNGISWQSLKGVNVAIQICDSTVVQVIGRSQAGPDVLCQYISETTHDIISTIHQVSPNFSAASYIIHTPDPFKAVEAHKTTLPCEMYPTRGILSGLQEGQFCLSRPDGSGHSRSLPISTMLSGAEPKQQVIEKLCYLHSTESDGKHSVSLFVMHECF